MCVCVYVYVVYIYVCVCVCVFTCTCACACITFSVVHAIFHRPDMRLLSAGFGVGLAAISASTRASNSSDGPESKSDASTYQIVLAPHLLGQAGHSHSPSMPCRAAAHMSINCCFMAALPACCEDSPPPPPPPKLKLGS